MGSSVQDISVKVSLPFVLSFPLLFNMDMLGSHASSPETLVLIALLAAFVIVVVRTFQPKRNLPPGPKGLPILGNLLQVPKFPWLRYTEWKDEFGRFSFT
jgi:hypothetical protein